MCFSFPCYFPYYYLFTFLILHTNKKQKEEKQGTNEWCSTESGEEAITETTGLYVDCHSSEALVNVGYLSIKAQIGANTRSMIHQQPTTALQTMIACYRQNTQSTRLWLSQQRTGKLPVTNNPIK